MPTHRPHFPDLLFEAAARLRTWESALMRLFHEAGYPELRPSLVTRGSADEKLDPSATSREVLCLEGEHGVAALRSDFTVSLAELFVSRFEDPPRRVSYAGPVFRRPRAAWEPAERFEVGCESLEDDTATADHALYTLIARVPDALGLSGGVLQLGHAALGSRPLDYEHVEPVRRAAFVRALSIRALHLVPEALGDHPERARLQAHAKALLDDTPDESPYRAMLSAEVDALERTTRFFEGALPAGVRVRKDHADVAGMGFYTGPTVRLWAPHASDELLAGGRYDALYPALGKPWQAAGFCVRLSRLLDLAEAHPELFRERETAGAS
jgi:ATP phosphoribosyltransferase regulatory subunit